MLCEKGQKATQYLNGAFPSPNQFIPCVRGVLPLQVLGSGPGIRETLSDLASQCTHNPPIALLPQSQHPQNREKVIAAPLELPQHRRRLLQILSESLQ